MKLTKEQKRMRASLESSKMEITLDSLPISRTVVHLPNLFTPEEVRVDSDEEIEFAERIAQSVGESYQVNVYWRSGRHRLATSVQDCLSDFIKLVGANKDDVANFVRRYAPFYLSHQTDPDDPAWQYEPIELYRKWAKCYEAILRIAASLHKRTAGLPDDDSGSFENWKSVVWTRELRQSDWRKLRPDIARQKSILAAILNGIIGAAEVSPFLVWNDEKPTIALGTDNTIPLFWDSPDRFRADTEIKGVIHVRGILALQLVAAVASLNGIWICDACRRPYTPSSRKGRGDGQHLCSDACRETRERERKKIWAQNNKRKTESSI